MPLTNDQLKHHFGNAIPQQRYARDVSGNYEYEGYAAPGISDSAPGWLIIKRYYTGAEVDAGKSVANAIWDARTLYTYS